MIFIVMIFSITRLDLICFVFFFCMMTMIIILMNISQEHVKGTDGNMLVLV